MKNPPEITYGFSLESVLTEFLLHLKYTFGNTLKYVGTTTDIATPTKRIRDIDIMLIFSQLNESTISYVWRIINKLHTKHSIIFDVRIYSDKDLPSISDINKYLLGLFLKDRLGTNPFKDYSPGEGELNERCIERIKEQESKIVNLLPRIAGDQDQLRTVAQSVYDAIRAFLIIEKHPIASKENACSYFSLTYPKFQEVSAIYDGYLDPESVVDVGSYILDSLAIVKHLSYRAQNKSIVNKVLLINTPSSIMAHPRDDYLSYDHNMPLGLVCIASFLEARGFNADILDSYAENLGVLSTIDRIYSNDAIPKVIGFNCSSPNVHIVHKIAHYLKRINRETIIVCGGPHPSLAMEHTLSTGDVDYVVRGEGELSFLKLIEALFAGKYTDKLNIPGIFFISNGKVVGEPNNKLMDLKDLPMPNYNKLPIERYFAVKKRLYIHTSRGCTFRCIYCSVPECWGRVVREIPIYNLFTQIQHIIKKYNPDEFQIVDDNFSYRHGQIIREYCKRVHDLGLKLKWKCQVRADQLDSETIKHMFEAGCFEVDLGIESGNKDIQKKINKNLDLEKTLEIISVIKSHNIFSKAFIMLGFPDEAYSQISDTINYVIELKKKGLNDVAFFPVMPFPGTEISKITGRMVFQGAIIDDVDIYERSFAAHRLRKYSAKPEISLNSDFTPEQLRLLVKFAYQRFNLGVPVVNLRDEFKQFELDEESNLYGI